MYKVCIADDEMYVRKSIISRIQPFERKFEVAGTADNGIDALELYHKTQPDVFLVDINMPVLSGLELIEQIRKEKADCNTKFIIISGYDDFSFMRKAIQLGVTNYIKKPILQNEFETVMDEVYRQLNKEQMKKVKKYQNIRKWKDYIQEQESETASCSIFLMEKENILWNAEELMGEIRLLDTESSWIPVQFSGTSDILMVYGKEVRENVLAGMRRIAETRQIHVIYHNGIVENMREIPGRFEDAMNARFFRKRDMFIELEKFENPGIQLPYGELEKALENEKYNMIESSIDQILDPILEDIRYCSMIRPAVQAILLTAAGKYTEYHLPVPEQIRYGLLPFALCHIKKKEMLKQELYRCVQEIYEQIQNRKKKSELIDNIVLYLERHFHEDISLSSVAGEFFVVPTYLAKKFKEKKGCSIMQFLEQIRMRRACELLRTSSLSITEIAQRVGYNDSNYFTRSFVKIHNITPREYRKQEEMHKEKC